MASPGAHLTTFFYPNPPRTKGYFARVFLWNSMIALMAAPLIGQGALSIGSASTVPGSAAVLTVSTAANGGVQPAVLRWTMQYPPDVTGIDVAPGPAALDAGKTVTCSYTISSATCLAWGENATVIPDGPVATATFQISAASKSSAIVVTNVAGSASDLEGNSLSVTSAGGVIALLLPPAISCPSAGPRLLNQYFSTQCSVTGGVPPYNWQISSGTLPPGLSIIGQGASALIAGTPTASGVYRYTISVSDSNSPSAGKGTLAFAVTIQSS